MSTILFLTDIVGYIGLLLLYLQIVFGTRHVFKVFSRNTVLMNTKWHYYIGKYAIFALLAHPLLSMMARLEDLAWIFTPNWNIASEGYITLGRFALYGFLIVWITSALVRGKIKWHPWKWVHLLAYPVTVLVFFHAKNIGSLYEKYYFIQILWIILFALLIGAIVLRLLNWAGLLKYRYTIINKELVGTDIYHITLKPLDTPLTSHIGQHFFLQAEAFRSEHPFTVVHNTDGTIEFLVRKVAGFFKTLESKKVGDTILVDGAYGVFTKEAQNENPKVIISAGVGVTPFVDLVEHFGKNTTYINCNRSLPEAFGRDTIKSHVTKYVDIVDSYEGQISSDIIVSRITPEIIKTVVGPDIVTLPFFVCGSPIFIKIVKGMLVQAGVDAKQVYYEELGF